MYATEGGNGLPTNYIHCIRVSSGKLLCLPKCHLIQSLTAQI